MVVHGCKKSVRLCPALPYSQRETGTDSEQYSENIPYILEHWKHKWDMYLTQ